MSLGSIGAVLVVLVVVFLIGHAWFAIVEWALGVFRRLFGRKETGAWHVLPSEPEKKEDEEKEQKDC